jgi:hypothetical protein
MPLYCQVSNKNNTNMENLRSFEMGPALGHTVCVHGMRWDNVYWQHTRFVIATIYCCSVRKLDGDGRILFIFKVFVPN